MTIRARALTKDYPRSHRSGAVLTAVAPTDLELAPGSLTVVTGRSGSGKSTLLMMLAGLLTPTAGTVEVEGRDLYALAEGERSRLRNGSIGLVPQGHAALRSLTVLDNVLLPAVIRGDAQPPVARAASLLEDVGLAELAGEYPQELSGGELRRLALARALLLGPAALLADEPTAGLDSENVEVVLAFLRQAADEGAAVLVVTHEAEARTVADRVLTMDGGRLS
ncbi:MULTISPECIES: ATP-binding cassette domain-containing protein [unclassified Actinomyces]|uniref:ABC transporter ATP-binding protein n=1 Tax=unclassified Actinomyces TaxID=2609248 RepID=UPI002017CC3A|nr:MULTISPECIES: ATP-binding cassette domain-containing protein [unclassified Actinomyces]MCL3777275.1 ATP-binding cassette domain-containing protein [Actinomyces sp. AC-20-1]MCL3789913.1 ATP-binding cassette domain-containing protein [Actinomyces sp. 187325]MCL3792129.1 ATP-binding cassette domain-containing protein [Actinomyces sp. 186855]MCL3793637.1 ATP-binding cassette domain-containing protein [Actinomyces sp. 217892]